MDLLRRPRGSAGPLRERKLTAFEGGQRPPFIARWPGHIAAALALTALTLAARSFAKDPVPLTGKTTGLE